MELDKALFKRVIPIQFHSSIGAALVKIKLIGYLWGDMKHLFFPMLMQVSIRRKLRAKIIQNYHRLEKALATPDFAPGRGFRAAVDLCNALEQYNNDCDSSDSQVMVAFGVLKKFLDKQGAEAEFLKTRFYRLESRFQLSESDYEIYGGIQQHKRQHFISNRNSDFQTLCNLRHSVRDFARCPVDLKLIIDGINTAQRTPSVCNRQGWHVFVVTRPDAINIFKQVHNGFARHDQYLSTLLVICFSKSSFNYPLERHQGYTDGGLFSMSVMYALTQLGLASCPLNANLTGAAERKLRECIKIPGEYGIVMFIAVGHYPEVTVTAVSHRDDAMEKLTFVT
ncbi:nitroreductase family protein [Gammaproteobacteria bacterium]|nr:nitroreductase family protein [Gammaproteobacteria bacterium]